MFKGLPGGGEVSGVGVGHPQQEEGLWSVAGAAAMLFEDRHCLPEAPHVAQQGAQAGEPGEVDGLPRHRNAVLLHRLSRAPGEDEQFTAEGVVVGNGGLQFEGTFDVEEGPAEEFMGGLLRRLPELFEGGCGPLEVGEAPS